MCEQLGFYDAVRVELNSFFGDGTGPHGRHRAVERISISVETKNGDREAAELPADVLEALVGDIADETDGGSDAATPAPV